MSGVYYNLTLAVLLVILALAAYVDRMYSEMGKFLAREYQDNIDAWTRAVEPRLRLGRESIALSASVLRQLDAGGDCADCGAAPVRACESHSAGAGADRGRDCGDGLLPGAADPVLRPADSAAAVYADPRPVDCAYTAVAGGTVLPDSAGDSDAGAAAVDCGAGGAGRRGRGRASVRGDGRAAGSGRGGRHSGGERPRTGAVGGGVWRQSGARGDDAAAGDLCGSGDADAEGAFWRC